VKIFKAFKRKKEMLAEEDEAWLKKMEDDLKEGSKCMKAMFDKKIERMEALLEEERSLRKKVEENYRKEVERLWEAMQNKIDEDHKKEMDRKGVGRRKSVAR
jgi:acetyl-CoA carboxylase carboxyltransferase component